jgi:RNA polymerase sigma-70 factor (ECF subfamily)
MDGNTGNAHPRAELPVAPPARVADRSDAELIADLRTANGDACATLIRRYGRLVYRVASDILRDSGEAEDVTQEVFLEIYRHADRYDASRGTVKVWILQYAYHQTLRRKDTLRRRAAYRGAPLEELEGREAPTGDSRRQLTRDERRWVIRAGLAQLPERQRTTLELACFEELSLDDIAKRLRVSLGCARHYYYRGLARLKVWARAKRSPHPTRGPNESRDASADDRADVARGPTRRQYVRT